MHYSALFKKENERGESTYNPVARDRIHVSVICACLIKQEEEEMMLKNVLDLAILIFALMKYNMWMSGKILLL